MKHNKELCHRAACECECAACDEKRDENGIN